MRCSGGFNTKRQLWDLSDVASNGWIHEPAPKAAPGTKGISTVKATRASAVLFAAIGLLMASACGGDNDDNTSSDPQNNAMEQDTTDNNDVADGSNDDEEDAVEDDDEEDAIEDDEDASANNGEEDASPDVRGTMGVLCGLEVSAEQRLVYEQVNPREGTSTTVDETLPMAYSWTCDEGGRTLSGNGIPNHGVDNGRFASRVSVQNVSIALDIEPEVTGEITAVRLPGYALNSVKFDPMTAGTCPDDAATDTDCNYAMGSDMWQMVATPGDTSPWRFNFGVDVNDAHVQPNGAYHYHGNPVGLVETLNPNPETSMTLVGWAADGFPIYSIYAHADPQDAASEVVKMTSSYQTIEAVPGNRPSTDDFPLGHFEADWEYVEGSGTLDECNGRFGVTPEFPQGIYHYFVTETYPFVQRCVKGTSAPGTTGPPGGGMPPGP